MVDTKKYIVVENLKDALGILAVTVAFVGFGYMGVQNALRSGEIGDDSLLFLIAAGGNFIVLLLTAYEQTYDNS